MHAGRVGAGVYKGGREAMQGKWEPVAGKGIVGGKSRTLFGSPPTLPCVQFPLLPELRSKGNVLPGLVIPEGTFRFPLLPEPRSEGNLPFGG